LVLEQVLEEVVAPLRRCLRPGDFRATSDGVSPDAGAMLALPAEALVLEGAGFGLRADQRGIAGAVGLAEGVPTGDQCDRLLIVQRKAEDGLPDVLGCCDRVGLAVRPRRIDVDQAHLHRAERLCELALAAVALVAQPRAFRSPVQLLRLPHVGAAAGEAEG